MSQKILEMGESTAVVNVILLKKIYFLLFEMDQNRNAYLKSFIVYDGFNFLGQLKCLVEKTPL